MPDNYELRILKSLRQIIRAVDIHSREINSKFHVTVPQMLCLYSIERTPQQTMSLLARDVNLGMSTVNGIINRLETKQLVNRTRCGEDRRKFALSLTDKGKELVKNAPPMLQETLSKKLMELPELEQATISLALEKIIGLMEAQDIEASPNLISNGALDKEKDKTTEK